MRLCDVQVGVLRVGEQRSPVVSGDASAIHAARWKELRNPNPACLRSPVPLASPSLLAECAVPSPVRRAGSMCLCRVGRRVRGSCAVGVVLISA